jgi:hypothetical protein
MIRSDIISDVQRLVGRSDTNFNATLNSFLNHSVREWARKRPWLGLRRRISAFANGTPYIILPSYVERPEYIFDVTNARAILPGGNWDWEFASALAANQAGAALEWKDLGTVASVTDPAGYITIESDAAADTAINLHITGYSQDTTMSGTPLELKVISETLALNGQTPVTSTLEFNEIVSVGKESATSGSVSVRDAASSTMLSRVGPDESESVHRRIQLMRVPSSGTQLQVLAVTKPFEMSNTNQAPHPSIDSDFLVWNTAGLALTTLGERQAGILYLQKARAILDDESFVDENFGDQFIQMIPTYNSFEAEDNLSD